MEVLKKYLFRSLFFWLESPRGFEAVKKQHGVLFLNGDRRLWRRTTSILKWRCGAKDKKNPCAGFCVWLGHSCFVRRSASAKRKAEWGSHLSRKPSGSSLASGSAKNPRRRRVPLCRSFQNYSSTVSGPPDVCFANSAVACDMPHDKGRL